MGAEPVSRGVLATESTAGSADVRPGVTLGLLSVLHSIIHAQGAFYPLVFLAVIDDFKVTPDAIAFLAAVGAIVTGGIQLGFGAATRRFSRRALLAAGGLLLGLATAAQALASTFAPFAIANVVSRLGGAPQHPVGNALLAEQFPEKRLGFAISAHVAGGNVGTLIAGVVVGWAIANLGWRGSVVALGLPAIVVSIAITLWIRESGTDRVRAVRAGSIRGAYRRVIGDANLRWVFLSSVLGGGARGLGVLNVFVPFYLKLVAGLDDGTVGAMYAVLLIASVPGPLVAGWLSDRLGRKPVIIGVYVAGAVSLAFFVLVGNGVIGLWTAIVILSIFSFVESPQLQALLADIAPAELRDAAYSTYFALAFGVGSTWGIVYGAVLAAFGSASGLPLVFWIMALANTAAALSVLPIRLSGEATTDRRPTSDL